MKVGDYVTYQIPKPARSDAFNYGRLCAIEVHQDDHGERTWYYVRWIDGNGKPDERIDKVALAEIRLADVEFQK